MVATNDMGSKHIKPSFQLPSELFPVVAIENYPKIKPLVSERKKSTPRGPKCSNKNLMLRTEMTFS